MSADFNPGAVYVEVEYRAIKTLRLTVYPPDGRVKIAAPLGTSEEYIRKFVASKAKFIEKHREKFLNHARTSGALRNNAAVYIWGRPYTLEIIERGRNSKIVIEGERLKMFVPPGSSKAKRQEYLDRWYSRLLKEAAPGIIEKWEARVGVAVKKLYVRKMKSHWGSCNHERQSLRLNSELAKRSPECLEYVIVHEMIHIIESGHNRNFYRILNQHLPQWKSILKKMNSGDM